MANFYNRNTCSTVKRHTISMEFNDCGSSENMARINVHIHSRISNQIHWICLNFHIENEKTSPKAS